MVTSTLTIDNKLSCDNFKIKKLVESNCKISCMCCFFFNNTIYSSYLCSVNGLKCILGLGPGLRIKMV